MGAFEPMSLIFFCSFIYVSINWICIISNYTTRFTLTLSDQLLLLILQGFPKKTPLSQNKKKYSYRICRIHSVRFKVRYGIGKYQLLIFLGVFYGKICGSRSCKKNQRPPCIASLFRFGVHCPPLSQTTTPCWRTLTVHPGAKVI